MMGPGNGSAVSSNPSLPLVNGAVIKDSPEAQRRRAIARRLDGTKNAIAAGKLSNVPDDKKSFEGM